MSICLSHENHCLLSALAAKVPMWLWQKASCEGCTTHEDEVSHIRNILATVAEGTISSELNFSAKGLKMLLSISAAWPFAALGQFLNSGYKLGGRDETQAWKDVCRPLGSPRVCFLSVCLWCQCVQQNGWGDLGPRTDLKTFKNFNEQIFETQKNNSKK